MFRGSGLGQDIIVLPPFPCRYGYTGFEAEAVVAGLKDVAAVGQAVEECGRHLGVPKDGGPFAEAQVCGDDGACPFVEFTQQMDGAQNVVMLDSLHAKGCRGMRFASPRAPDQHDVLGTIHELSPMKLAHRGLVDLTGGEVEG